MPCCYGRDQLTIIKSQQSNDSIHFLVGKWFNYRFAFRYEQAWNSGSDLGKRPQRLVAIFLVEVDPTLAVQRRIPLPNKKIQNVNEMCVGRGPCLLTATLVKETNRFSGIDKQTPGLHVNLVNTWVQCTNERERSRRVDDVRQTTASLQDNLSHTPAQASRGPSRDSSDWLWKLTWTTGFSISWFAWNANGHERRRIGKLKTGEWFPSLSVGKDARRCDWCLIMEMEYTGKRRKGSSSKLIQGKRIGLIWPNFRSGVNSHETSEIRLRLNGGGIDSMRRDGRFPTGTTLSVGPISGSWQIKISVTVTPKSSSIVSAECDDCKSSVCDNEISQGMVLGIDSLVTRFRYWSSAELVLWRQGHKDCNQFMSSLHPHETEGVMTTPDRLDKSRKYW